MNRQKNIIIIGSIVGKFSFVVGEKNVFEHSRHHFIISIIIRELIIEKTIVNLENRKKSVGDENYFLKKKNCTFIKI